MIDPELITQCRRALSAGAHVTVMTGAGVSAESGIPTFRGKEGYWTVGSTVYQPEEMATCRMFRQRPADVWRWYCYRRALCSAAKPNRAHFALAEMEKMLKDRFTLITQNVDGLHLRAGNTPSRTFQIHGNIHMMRCADACSDALYPFPDSFPLTPARKEWSDEDIAILRCPACGGWARPHILWFDECYDETFYRFETSLEIAAKTDLLLVVGTSGATNLPNHVMQIVLRRGGFIVDLNIEENRFGKLAAESGNGVALIGAAGELLPELVAGIF